MKTKAKLYEIGRRFASESTLVFPNILNLLTRLTVGRYFSLSLICSLILLLLLLRLLRIITEVGVI